MKNFSRKLLWTSLSAALLALTPACDKDDEPEADECGEPLYGGDATDEAWRAMVDAKSRATASAQSVTLESPTEGQQYVTTEAAPTWSWTSPIASLVPGSEPAGPASPVRAHKGRSVLAWLGNLILPSAEAHLPPFTGDLYWVEVTVPGRKCPVAMLTNNLEWQLDAATWDTLRGAVDKDLSIQVTSAYLVENRLREGPYKLATPRTVHMVGAR
ncbi:hypothetical protein JY651_44375 [Pyxidicoccus parkwayensis]|uniref:Lipoprotein n=1 Tax=Pyxidicoccus parkwayensis TaxID=2813578 RepID=A0ABX7P138_9BACT|nr:hypothetical protein [Pyxidicoccus parkwaysis]QSQ22103.1 hypothetical protein JY651_44375 [Pyxidicoccus parkwaysis]